MHSAIDYNIPNYLRMVIVLTYMLCGCVYLSSVWRVRKSERLSRTCEVLNVRITEW